MIFHADPRSGDGRKKTGLKDFTESRRIFPLRMPDAP